MAYITQSRPDSGRDFAVEVPKPFREVPSADRYDSNTLSHSLTLSLSHSRTLSLSHSRTLTLSHSLTLSLSHTHTLSHSHSLALSHSLTLSLSDAHLQGLECGAIRDLIVEDPQLLTGKRTPL